MRPHGAWGPHVAEIHQALGQVPGLPLRSSTTTGQKSLDVFAARAGSAKERRLWLERAAVEVQAIADPVEKIVRVVGACTSLINDGYRSIEFAIDATGLQRLLPELFPPGVAVSLNYPPPWSHDAVQAWFLRSVRSSPTHSNLAVAIRGVFGSKERRVRAWGFQHGSTRPQPSGEGNMFFASIFIGEDGQRLYEPRMGSCSYEPLAPHEGFNAHALRHMARLVGLPELGVRDSTPAN
jgi:hypothetical protein